MDTNDKIFIELLKYGAEKGLEGVTADEITNWAIGKGFVNKNPSTPEQKIKQKALHRLLNECFNPCSADKGPQAFVLINEYYFRLIEYQELQESRRAAREASRNAFMAIGISIFAIIITAFLTYTQLNTPTIINQSNLNALIESNRKANIQSEVKLDSLQMAQILSAIEYSQPKTKAKKLPANDQGKEISQHELINRYFEELR
ncbi:MAG: hypothetical protein GY699_01905 [Desulfobacteraceae bacterium]|nr:hypothetical protein [Desulfobacteraceae bacterium]